MTAIVLAVYKLKVIRKSISLKNHEILRQQCLLPIFLIKCGVINERQRSDLAAPVTPASCGLSPQHTGSAVVVGGHSFSRFFLLRSVYHHLFSVYVSADLFRMGILSTLMSR